MNKRAIALSLCAAIGVACGDDEATPTSGAGATTGAGGAMTGGSSVGGATAGGAGGAGATGGEATGGTGEVIVGGDRPVEVFVPSSYDGSEPTPLVILLHGYTASGALQEIYMQIQPEAEARGFLYAHPDGTTDALGNQFWNATPACCGFTSTVDDSGYLRGVIDEIKQVLNVDDKRVFLIGHSNGGFMSYRMACDHADAVAAFASLAGAMFDDPSSCAPSEGVAGLQIHGTNDETIAYAGGSNLGYPYPGAVATTESWAGLMSCTVTPDTSAPPLDLDSDIMGAESTVARYGSECDPGGHAELWTIVGGTHIPTLSDSFIPSALDFLFDHPKP
jgi:polyhydroxybutyrate depolymerase